MTIKVFLGQAAIVGYQADPPDTFRMVIDFTMYMSNVTTHSGSITIDIPVGTTPYAVYAQVFQMLLAEATAYNLELPTKNDVFGYIPTPFSVLLPDLPSFT